MNKIALVLVILGLLLIGGALTDVPGRIGDIVHNYKVPGSSCSRLGETAKARGGVNLVCRQDKSDYELRWRRA